MTRKQKYFFKQRTIGLLLVIFSLVTMIDFGSPAGIILGPLGFVMIVTEKMIWDDDYSININHKDRGL